MESASLTSNTRNGGKPQHDKSLMFLIAASNFNDALHASHAEDTTLFKHLEEIVEKYVLEGAPFEINIDSQTKSRILRLTSADNFHKLSMVRTCRLLI